MFTYDLSTTLGKVRLFISDTNVDRYVFEDEELQVLINIEAGADGSQYPRLAAAAALDIIAADELRRAKVIWLLDVRIDGAKFADALHALAKALRDQEADQPVFEIVEMVYNVFGYRERVLDQFVRGEF